MAGWLTGSFTGYAEGISFEVYSLDDVLLDQGTSIDFGATTFSIGMKELDLPSSRPSFYRLRFISPGALKKSIVVWYDPAVGLSGVRVDLAYGDVDQNNVIDHRDLSLITEFYGKTKSEAEFWVPSFTGATASSCDINGDGVIDPTDYEIARTNLCRRGERWTPHGGFAATRASKNTRRLTP
ncbi:MAG TPA: dockerin type I domain-containing protein [Fimbriimonadaceae bacterium]|nr:dockerin type I domain-containing protein [Fimbriimonadaceae bacterium]